MGLDIAKLIQQSLLMNYRFFLILILQPTGTQQNLTPPQKGQDRKEKQAKEYKKGSKQ
ncbi:hypothetical protein DR78_1968 [Francisella philomiragia]|uniref:Uncharacterized protein n=1 Tax=Francisella philomiragia TaxID=28110 RepID=A0AAW3DEM0_9GAMM|nr:hypothetical protein DR78_1968 [Francisella philomiragia]